MKKHRIQAIFAAAVACILLIVSISACGHDSSSEKNDGITPPVGTPPASTPPETPTAPAPVRTPEPKPEEPPEPENLVPYDGAVEHLFFHEIIAYPELAFNGNSQQQGYEDNMVTVLEYNRILKSLYEEGYILVNMNDVWSEYTDDNGSRKMKKNTLMLPEGKKPLILSFDDLSFYEYMDGHGFMDRYIVGEDGEIWASGVDPKGNPVITQELTAVTILEHFIKEHPDFSHNGVKGCIALTGYNGILGYRTHTDQKNNSREFQLNRMTEIAAVRPVVKKFKEQGWYFATHSYGHINLASASLTFVKNDAQRWMDEVGSLVGETKLFIYPFGSRLDGDDVKQVGPAFKFYHELGFRVFASVGREPYSQIKSDIAAVICDRMAVDGNTLRNQRDRFIRFYDSTEILDPARPAR